MLGLTGRRAEAHDEGYAHLDRLAEGWNSAVERFDGPGEALFATFVDGRLVGIGGVTREPTDPDGDLLRARRVYVRRVARGRGAGRAIADAIVSRAFETVSMVTVHAGPGASGFWEHLGFERVDDRPGITHILRRND